ncbi:hypothetical protein M2440_000279 [Methylorubrum extorquens]|nr:hypothetical protein [Methylorubrum extorquens]
MSRPESVRIAYFVHDLNDPAVRRRIRMFKAGGAEIYLAGFRRGLPVTSIEGVPAHDLGRTADGRFLKRVAATAWAALNGRAAGQAASRVRISSSRGTLRCWRWPKRCGAGARESP